jgi:hypothetical protein
MKKLAIRRKLTAGAVVVIVLGASLLLGRYASRCSPIIFFVVSWAALAGAGLPKPHWAALRASVPVALFLSQMPYLGFLLLPVEIALSGALVGNRKSLSLWKAILLMAVLRIAIIAVIEPWYIKDMLD